MKQIYWKLLNNSVAITTIIEETSINTFRPTPESVVIDSSYLKNLPLDYPLETWRFIDGVGITVDEELLNEKVWQAIKLKRNELLKESDTYLIRLVESGQDTESMRLYRQALREITNQPDPNNIKWPLLPNVSFN